MVASPYQPRLLVVTDDSSNGGTAHLTRQLATSLLKYFKVEFAGNLATHRTSDLTRLKGLGAGLHNYAVRDDNLSQQTHGTRFARELLDRTKPDLILCVESSIASLQSIKREAADARLPYVIIVNSVPIVVDEHIKRDLMQAQDSIRAAAAVVFVSESHRSRWRELFPQQIVDTQVISNFCDERFFAPCSNEKRLSIRNVLGVGQGDILCLTAARLRPEKGQSLSLRALKRANEVLAKDNVRFAFAGSSSVHALERFHAEVEELGLSKLVSYLGDRKDIDDLLDASDCFVLASGNEGSPLSVIEAMAKGVPVIASNVGDLAQIVPPSCGVIITSPAVDEEACVAELAGELIHFASDTPRLLACARQARARADMLFRSEAAAEKYAALLFDIHRSQKARLPRPSYSKTSGQALQLWQSADFADPDTAWSILLDGWSVSERRGVWAVGTASTLKLDIASAEPAVRLRFLVKPFANAAWPNQSTEVYSGQNLVGEWQTSRSGAQTLDINLSLAEIGSSFELKFIHHRAASPYELGIGNDERRLSFFIRRLFVMPVARTLAHSLRYQALRARLI